MSVSQNRNSSSLPKDGDRALCTCVKTLKWITKSFHGTKSVALIFSIETFCNRCHYWWRRLDKLYTDTETFSHAAGSLIMTTPSIFNNILAVASLSMCIVVKGIKERRGICWPARRTPAVLECIALMQTLTLGQGIYYLRSFMPSLC